MEQAINVIQQGLHWKWKELHRKFWVIRKPSVDSGIRAETWKAVRLSQVNDEVRREGHSKERKTHDSKQNKTWYIQGTKFCVEWLDTQDSIKFLNQSFNV